jgi:hypothetical protein
MTAIKRRDKKGSPTVRKVFNNTGLPLETIEALPVLFTVKNFWRERDIRVYRHPHKPGKLISVGVSFDQLTTTVCEETEDQWQHELDELQWRQHFVQE